MVGALGAREDGADSLQFMLMACMLRLMDRRGRIIPSIFI